MHQTKSNSWAHLHKTTCNKTFTTEPLFQLILVVNIVIALSRLAKAISQSSHVIMKTAHLKQKPFGSTALAMCKNTYLCAYN